MDDDELRIDLYNDCFSKNKFTYVVSWNTTAYLGNFTD